MPFLPAIATGLGAGMEYAGNMGAARVTRQQGARQAVAIQFQAQQQRINAGQQIAAAQRDAMEQRRQSTLIQSRALALAAASGGGAIDPSVVNIISGVAGEGAYRAGVALYQGEERARAMRMTATALDYDGELAKAGASERADAFERSGTASLAKGAMSLFSKYGYDQPKAGSAGAGWTSGYDLPMGRTSDSAWQNPGA